MSLNFIHWALKFCTFRWLYTSSAIKICVLMFSFHDSTHQWFLWRLRRLNKSQPILTDTAKPVNWERSIENKYSSPSSYDSLAFLHLFWFSLTESLWKTQINLFSCPPTVSVYISHKWRDCSVYLEIMTASGKLYQKLQMMSHSTENDLIQRMFLEMEPE